MYKVFFITFGCKVNHYETECMKKSFSDAGFEPVHSQEGADAVVINSCTVTSSGDSRVLSALRKARKELPEAVIALTGCYPQAAPEEAAKLSEADIICGTKERKKIPQLVEECLRERKRLVSLSRYAPGEPFECLECPPFDDNTRAFLKIQDGCDRFCSYCIIPYARGRSRSKPLSVIRDEARQIASSGKKEIVLTGINLAFYGDGKGCDLADAVEACAAEEGIVRIRLGSLEPEVMSDEMLGRLAASGKVCPQFHLSLQSGCTRTLKAMNRRYTAEEYYELACRIRKLFPDCAFTTDVMVGFPGETDEDHRESADFIKKIGFSRVHIFRYSRRKGTPADRMKEQVPESVKSARAADMALAASQAEEKYMQSLVGKTVEVLFERENCTEFHTGHAADYTLIKIPRKNPEKSLRNQLRSVIIEESRQDHCIGRMTDDCDLNSKHTGG